MTDFTETFLALDQRLFNIARKNPAWFDQKTGHEAYTKTFDVDGNIYELTCKLGLAYIRIVAEHDVLEETCFEQGVVRMHRIPAHVFYHIKDEVLSEFIRLVLD